MEILAPYTKWSNFPEVFRVQDPIQADGLFSEVWQWWLLASGWPFQKCLIEFQYSVFDQVVLRIDLLGMTMIFFSVNLPKSIFLFRIWGKSAMTIRKLIAIWLRIQSNLISAWYSYYKPLQYERVLFQHIICSIMLLHNPICLR